MSKILRRPMFRGGPVDSRGTGITSGLMDGGRVGYNQGKLVLGGDLYKQEDYTDFIKQNFGAGRKTEGFAPALLNQMFDSEGNLKEDYTYENIFSQATGEKGKDAISVYDTDLLSYSDEGLIPGSKSKRITSVRPLANLLKGDVTETLKASEAYDTPPTGPAELGMTTREQPDDPPPPPPEKEEPTELDAATIVRERADLFKELLGEQNEKKLKDARISDASDYALKFFEGSQKEGATVGSSAADVAAFATSRDSKTEKAKAGIEKQDQTAIALAINDYIAGNRNKEQIDLLQAKMGINFANQIALIDYKNKKNNFFDNFKENRKSMNQSKALIFTIKETFGKNAKNVDDGANITFKENIGEYFIFPDGSVRTVIENSNGKLVEDILIGSGG